MNTKDDGKKIKQFDMPINDEMHTMHSDGDMQYSLLATYHGDRDEFWIVGMKEGQEVERYNPKHVAYILWDNDHE